MKTKIINIRHIELRNFKNHNSLVVDLPNDCTGAVVYGRNGSGKSSILEAITFCLGSSAEAGKVINQTTKAPVSVSLTIEHPEGTDTFTRVLTPTLNEAGKVTASTSSYSISGTPKKQTEYQTAVTQLFGTRDWMFLLRPELNAANKDARAILLQVAGAPEERTFLAESNQQLANIIGNTSFSDFERKKKQILESLGKRISTEIPAKIEEISAMLQPVEEIDLTGVEDRIKAINSELSGVDQINSKKQADYEKTLEEAQSLRNEAQKLRNLAAQKVAEANREANKQADEADAIIAEWNRTLSGLRRQADQIKAEMSEARTDLARAEARAQELYAEAMQHAEAHKQTSLSPIDSEKLGQCQVCQKWCGDLAARGAEAAEKQRTNELARILEAGKQVMSLRGKELVKINKQTDRIDSLMSKEHEIESKINSLGEAPEAPERKVITETPESLGFISRAEKLEATAEKLIKENRLDIAQKPTELIEELQQLNETLARGAAATQQARQNEKIQQRISELREEESALITTQLQHKQHIAQLKEFYKQYADSVTASVTKLFDGTDYKVKLFDENMQNTKGVPVMLPMKDGSSNLSTAESLIFGKLFIERVLSAHYGVVAPIIIDNGECVSDETKLGSLHQKLIACVDKCDLNIVPLTQPNANK